MGANTLEGVDEVTRIMTELSIIDHGIFRLQANKLGKIIRRERWRVEG